MSGYLKENQGWADKLTETIIAKNFNLAAEHLFEAESNQELVSKFNETFTDDSFRFFVDTLCAFYRGESKWIAEAEMITLQGNRIKLSMLASFPPFTNDSWSTVYLSALDITETQLLQNQVVESLHKMKILATTDELTGLLNRRAITVNIQEELARSRREGSQFCLAIVDIDGFKEINDEFGHMAGDKVLKLIADEMVRNVREYDQVGRWGGDEFLVLIPGADSLTAKQVADRVCSAISNKRFSANEGEALKLSISMGIFIYDGTKDEFDLDELVSRADKALYNAKKLGGNQFVT